MHLSEDWLETIRSYMPLLPWEVQNRLNTNYQLTEYDANFIAEDKLRFEYFEATAVSQKNYKSIVNWMMGPIRSHQNNVNVKTFGITSDQLAGIISLIDNNEISFSSASDMLFPELVNKPELEVKTVAKKLGLLLSEHQVDLEGLVTEVISAFPEKVAQYRSSKKGKALLGMFMGELMKRSNSKINPKEANKVLVAKLNES